MSLTRTESLPPSRPASPDKSSLQSIRRYGSVSGYRLRLRPSIDTSSRASLLVRPEPRVPMEMIEAIIKHYAAIMLAPSMEEGGSLGSQKSAFMQFFSPLSLVSTDVRYLTLREFFRVLVFCTTEDSTGLLKFLDLLDTQFRSKGWIGGYRWVRLLSAPSFLIPPNIKCLQNLHQLEELRVDFSHSGLALQRACITQLFTSLATTQNAVLNLTRLKLTQLPRIDAQLLGFVAKGLPNLVYLHCTSIEGLDMDCCPNCYEDSLSRINHSPIPDMFPDAIHLAHAFGSALEPLKNLAYIFFGVFLSPTHMLELHTRHGANIDHGLHPDTVDSIYNCGYCLQYEKMTKQRELVASLVLAQHLGALASIGWSSCFGTPCAEASDRSAKRICDVLESGGDLGGRQRKSAARRPCECEGHGLKTMLSVDRAGGKVKVSREL